MERVYNHKVEGEEIIDEYSYCGFEIKICKVGEKFYGTTNIELLMPPTYYCHKHSAEREAQKIIDKHIDNKN
jgi:hypothetical protein